MTFGTTGRGPRMHYRLIAWPVLCRTSKSPILPALTRQKKPYALALVWAVIFGSHDFEAKECLMPTAQIEKVIRHVRKVVVGDGGKSDSQLLDSFLAANDQAAFEALVR